MFFRGRRQRAAAVGVVASAGYYIAFADLLPNGTVVRCFDAGVPGTMAGVARQDATLLDGTLQVLLAPSAAAVDAARPSRMSATLAWGAPVVAAGGMLSAVLMILRLQRNAAQAAATHEALSASDGTRDSLMAFIFHELRNPLATMGLV
jgi:hypothetical protein